MKALLLAVLAVCLVASPAHAQDILGEISTDGGVNYSGISGSPFDSGDPISVSLGSVTGDVLLRFRDSHSESVTAHLGAITIGGTLGSSAGRVSIIVAKGFDAFPNTQFLLLNPSVVNVAGITVSDADLSANTRVAMAATGNLTGSIEVGHVFRLQFNTVGSTVGEIQGAVTATAENGSVVTYTGVDDENGPIYAEPMAYVRASKKISGNLTATAGDIGIVSIGVTEAQTDGLQANVKALAGQIKSIYCAGAIGDPTASPAVVPEIWAREKITEIIATNNEAIEPSILAKNFHASIKSGVGRAAEVYPVDPFSDGALHLLRTDGDYSGDIAVRNITPPRSTSGLRSGILIGGAMLGEISVDYLVHGADIVASTFAEPITIGVQLMGSIVASDPEGVLYTVSIGRGYSEEAYEYTGDPQEQSSYAFYRGFAGSWLGPKDDALYFEDPALWLGGNVPVCGGDELLNLGSMDSLIRASHIEWLSIRSMQSPATPLDAAPKGRPRVEAATMGTCIVDLLRAGVIWSGALEFENDCNCSLNPGCFGNDPSNDFASIETLLIGCMTRYSAIWYKDCVYAKIGGSVYGQIHVPELTAAQTLWIGDSLTYDNAEPYPGIGSCVPPHEDGYFVLSVFQNQSSSPSDDSPRYMYDPNVGHVYLHHVGGLAGQIIINGNNGNTPSTTNGTWDGAVVIGEDDAQNRITLHRDEPQPYQAPYYSLPSEHVGGGAVGVVPFAFYPTDCKVPHGELGPTDGLTYSHFEETAPIRLRWYGPIQLVDEELAAIDFIKVEVQNPSEDCSWIDLTTLFVAKMHPDVARRELGLGATVLPREGVYRVSYHDAEYSRFVCDDVLGTPPQVGVFPDDDCGDPMDPTPDVPSYQFRVLADCDGNNVADYLDIAGDALLDQNHNGFIDVCEGTTCLCDWNDNNMIDVEDIFAFLSAWFENDPGAQCYGSPPPPEDPVCGVPALFAFLTCWFNSLEDEICNPQE